MSIIAIVLLVVSLIIALPAIIIGLLVKRKSKKIFSKTTRF